MRNFVLLTTGLLMSGALFANAAQPAAMQQTSAPAMQGSDSVALPPPPAAFCKAYPEEKICQEKPAAMPENTTQPAAMPENTTQPAAIPANNMPAK